MKLISLVTVLVLLSFFCVAGVIQAQDNPDSKTLPANLVGIPPKFPLSSIEELALKQLIERKQELQKQVNVIVAPWQSDVVAYEKAVLEAHGNPPGIFFDKDALVFKYIPPAPAVPAQAKQNKDDKK